MEINLKADPHRPGMYVIEEAQSSTHGVNRWRFAVRSHAWRPPTDVFETDDAVVVRIEIAGMLDKDFTIALSDRFLIVRGVRSDIVERRAYHQMEIFFGEFITEVELPCPVVSDEVVAEYNLGFLRLVMPKENSTRIQVNP